MLIILIFSITPQWDIPENENIDPFIQAMLSGPGQFAENETNEVIIILLKVNLIMNEMLFH